MLHPTVTETLEWLILSYNNGTELSCDMDLASHETLDLARHRTLLAEGNGVT